MAERSQVLISLGSNIDRKQNILRAVALLRHRPELEVRAASPVYESSPVGGNGHQPAYYNAAVLAETSLEPAGLRELLRAVERLMGRVRTGDKYAPRPIDLDIALYGQRVLDLAGRHIPDPEIIRFPHLALPLADVAPGWIHPEVGLTLAEIVRGLEFSETEIYQVMDAPLVEKV